MQSVTLIFLAAVVTVALAEGQFYVPRAYYTIDAEGHASAPVPLRRLRRSLSPYPYAYPGAGASANANANANAGSNGFGGGGASANANANANARSHSWDYPAGNYGASGGENRRSAGPVLGARYVLASSSVNIDSSFKGHYDQYAEV